MVLLIGLLVGLVGMFIPLVAEQGQICNLHHCLTHIWY